MSGNPRAIFDTNVLISSLLTNNSPPQQALDIIIDRGALLFSQASLTELIDVLAREKFDRYLSRERRARFVATLSKVAEIMAVTEQFTDCRDPDDNKFLDLAVAARRSRMSCANWGSASRTMTEKYVPAELRRQVTRRERGRC